MTKRKIKAPKESKIPWREVYKRFKEKYPSLGQHALGFEPYGYMAIKIFCEDRVHFVYDDNEKIVYRIQEPEIRFDKLAEDAKAYWKRKQEYYHWTDEETREHMYAKY